MVVSGGAAAYREALSGVERALAAEPAVVALSTTAEERALAWLAAQYPRAIVAIGPPAVRVACRAGAIVVAVLAPAALAPARARSLYVLDLAAPPAALLGELTALAPGVRTVWMITSARAPDAALEEVRAAVERAGLRLIATAVADTAGAARALRSPPAGVDAFLLLPDPQVRNAAFDEALLRLAFERRFAVACSSPSRRPIARWRAPRAGWVWGWRW